MQAQPVTRVTFTTIGEKPHHKHHRLDHKYQLEMQHYSTTVWTTNICMRCSTTASRSGLQTSAWAAALQHHGQDHKHLHEIHLALQHHGQDHKHQHEMQHYRTTVMTKNVSMTTIQHVSELLQVHVTHFKRINLHFKYMFDIVIVKFYTQQRA